jgi:hypothetical protein
VSAKSFSASENFGNIKTGFQIIEHYNKGMYAGFGQHISFAMLLIALHSLFFSHMDEFSIGSANHGVLKIQLKFNCMPVYQK